MTDDLGDFFGGGEGGGAPAISQKYIRPGESWEGILLPATGSGPIDGPAYRTTQQSNIENELLFWDDGKPRKQAEITLLTDYRKNEFLSDKAVARLAENDEQDNGLRRQFIKGSKKTEGSSAKEFGDAVARAGASRPQVGATVKQTFVKKVPAGQGKEAWFVKWEYTKPTDATLAKVKAHLEASASQDDALDDEPPF